MTEAGLVAVVDLGTQSLRAALVNMEGKVLGMAQETYDLESPRPGWAQQSPETWWAAACRTLKSVLRSTGADPAAIGGFACCGQMHGAVGIDARGDLTTEQAQLWCDKRCQEQCDQLVAQGREDLFLSITGNRVHAGWSALKYRWLRDHQPEVFTRTACFLTPKDYLNFRLTGVAATDPSEASGSYLWDPDTRDWSPSLAAALGLAREKLPPVLDSARVMGRITPAAAEATGLPAGTPVATGGGDFIVSILGLAAVEPGTAVDITGTSILFVLHQDQPIRARGISNLHHVVDGWLPFFMLDCGGLGVKWLRDLLRSAGMEALGWDRLSDLASQAPTGSDGLRFVPHLMGDRDPENAAARAGFIGLTLNHDARHLSRALLEGIALNVALGMEQMEGAGAVIRRVTSVGGGARNRIWNRIKAGAWGIPLTVSPEAEAGVRGAAVLAAVAAGEAENPSSLATRWAAQGLTELPDPELVRSYRDILIDQKRLQDLLKGYWT